MTPKQQQIHDRYMAGYVTDEQLLRYKELGVITETQYNDWYAEKHPTPNSEAVEGE